MNNNRIASELASIKRQLVKTNKLLKKLVEISTENNIDKTPTEEKEDKPIILNENQKDSGNLVFLLDDIVDEVSLNLKDTDQCKSKYYTSPETYKTSFPEAHNNTKGKLTISNLIKSKKHK